MMGQQRIFGHNGLAEGLPQETILCIDNDHNGFLWLGTSDGVVRFDGTEFYVPPLDANSGLDLSGLRAGAILVNNDIVYAGTGQKGILAYDTAQMTTSQIGLENSDCSALSKTSMGILAGYYDQGLGRIQGSNNFSLLRFREKIPKRVVTILELNAYIYLGTDDGFLYRFISSDIDSNKEIALQEIKKFPSGINRLIPKDNTLVVCTSSGIYNFSEDNVSPIQIQNEQGITAPFSVVDVYFSNQKTFIASAQGLLEGSWREDNVFTYSKHYTASVKYDPFSLNRDNINDIHEYDGVLFIGHNSLDITTVKTQEVFQSVVSEYKLGNPSVFPIFENSNQLWVGTTSGLLTIDKSSGQYSLLSEVRSRSIIEDKHGTIWVGTGSGILLFKDDEFNYSNPKYSTVREITDGKTTLSNPNIRSIYKDKNKNIWVVTYNKGVFKLSEYNNYKNLKFEAFFTEEKASVLPSPFTININQDTSGDYWLTTQKGLSRISFDNTRPIVKNYTEANGLASNGTLSTLIDSDGTLWVATRKGLSKYDYLKDQFTSYKKRDGLSNTFVYNILEDRNTNLWLSTNGGLFLFDKKKETFANYTPKDGVQSTEFNLGAAYKNDEGLLYFGGVGGLNKFNPEEVATLDKQTPIQFTKIKSQEKELPISKEEKATLKTAYNAFPLSLSFAAKDYRPSKNIQYQYRLLPDNTTWTPLGNKNSIQFLSLPSGSHTIEIQGLSRGLAWNQEPLRLGLTITPPWYKSTLAYLTYFLLFIAGAYVYYSIALQRRLAGQEAKRLQDLDDLKTRFITNITHEFRTPLTVILGYVHNLKTKLSTDSKETKELITIERNSENLLGLVNQMLDLAKLEQGRLNIVYHKNDIEAYAKVILESIESYALDKSITLAFSSALENPVLDYDEEMIRQILTNLISNAIKFTNPLGKVSLRISESDNRYILEVQDTGHGIPEEDLSRIFNRFYQVENNSFKVSQGTGIGLALTKELVELMEGEITVKSQLGSGTTFKVVLPISRQATYKEIAIPKNNGITNHIYVPDSNDKQAPEQAPVILVVEDNEDMARYITSCLQETYKIITAPNGQQGLDIALEKTPDIILSDVMMPIMDGFEMTRKLQKDQATNHIPIVLLTSKALQEDKMEGLESGAEAYLNKPFQKAELLLRLHNLIEKRRLLQHKYAVNKLLIPQEKSSHTPTDKNHLFLERAVTIVQENIDNAQFSPTQMAQELLLSDSQLYRKLKALSNTSTAIFIRTVRLERAKELLLSSDKTVSEIAYETGFSDPNWFGKAFKEHYKTTPSSLRNPSKHSV